MAVFDFQGEGSYTIGGRANPRARELEGGRCGFSFYCSRRRDFARTQPGSVVPDAEAGRHIAARSDSPGTASDVAMAFVD